MSASDPAGAQRTAVAAVRRHQHATARSDQDLVAVEAPLEIRIITGSGPSPVDLGILMRTPGDDDDLLTGLLYTEGVITQAADVLSLRVIETDTGQRAEVHLGPGAHVHAPEHARALITSSACGLCGRLQMLAADRQTPAPAAAPPLSPAIIRALPGRLREAQAVFAETGGLHAAGLFTAEGQRRWLREDVGRHNAVDKVVGAACRAGALPAHQHVLVVSGRVAYEIVQKAVMAGVGAVVAVGAPSSLAIEAARRTQLTLIGFVRDGRFNVYAGGEGLM